MAEPIPAPHEAEASSDVDVERGKRLPARAREMRLRPWHVSWLLGTPIAAILLWIIVTSPIGPSGEGGAGVVPGATFYLLGPETQGLQVGQRAPDLVGAAGGREVRLTGLDGRPIRIGDFRGRPLWIVFWATWCPPCQKETPDLRAAYEAHRSDGLALVAISLQEPGAVVRDYARRQGLTYDIAMDETGAVSAAYGVFGLPTHYFVDPNGVIRDRYFGPLTREQMDERIALISEG